MIREALQFLHDGWLRGQQPIEVPSGHPAKKIYLRPDSSGQWEEFDVDLHDPPLVGSVTSLESFVAGVNEYRQLSNVAAANGYCVVYVSDQRIQAVLQEGRTRLDRLVLDLTWTEPWKILRNLQMPIKRSQADLINLLRIDLHGMVDSVTIGKYRNLDWSQGSSVKSIKGLRDESLGRSVEAKVQAVDELPESILVTSQVWQQAPMAGTLPLYVDPEPLQSCFTVRVPPLQVDAEERLGLDGLVQLLRGAFGEVDDQLHVLAGRPEIAGAGLA